MSMQIEKLSALLLALAIWTVAAPLSVASPLTARAPDNMAAAVPDDELVLPLDGATLKSFLLYNRLNQLVQTEPEMLDLLDLDHGRLARIVDELLSQSGRSKRQLNVKSSKRAAAMGVDLPDYILHINKGRNFDFSSFREKMQKSG